MMLPFTTIESFLTKKLPGYLSILQFMVEINSFTANSAGVNQLGNYSADIFSHLGFDVTPLPSVNPKYGKHVFLRKSGKTNHSIALISHLDTVFPPEEEKQNNFTWRIEGDRAYGPGSVDIKGGTLMIYMVLDALRQFYPQVFEEITWLIALDATEEVLSDDFGQNLLNLLNDRTLACLVFEGGTPLAEKYPLVTARKGKANFRVEVEGRSAHAGNRHAQGANAIVQMAYTIQQIAALTDYDQQLTFNIGTVHGGSVVNRVPHRAEAEVEMRTFSTEVFHEGVKAILALDGQVQVTSQDGFPCKVIIRQIEENPPWPRNPETDRLFDVWKGAGKLIGLEIIPEERGGLSDGNHLWRHYPTLDGLGPVGNNAHCSERSADGSKDQEYAVVSSFVPKALMNIAGILQLTDCVSKL